MSTVYRARDTLLDRDVAIKLLEDNFSMGRRQEALKYSTLSRELGERTGAQARCLVGTQLAIYQTDLGQDDAALATANEAVDRSEKLGQDFMRCTSLHALGYFHSQREEWAQAVATLRDIGSRLKLGRALYRRSLAHRAAGDAMQARRDRAEALEILHECGAVRDYARASAE